MSYETIWRSLVLLCILSISTTALALPKTKITWHGHATFEIKTPAGAVLMIDPWLKNPKNPNKEKSPYSNIKRLDYILVTHGHFDHLADAAKLAKQTGARLITNFDLGKQMVKLMDYPKDQMGFDSMINIGGEIQIARGEVMVAMTNAVHSSAISNPFDENAGPALYTGGNPAGFVLKIRGGPTIYHSGDTAYFGDMAMIGEVYQPDVALLATGGHFTMEPAMAARAAMAIKPKLAIPQHFGTFPVLAQNIDAFLKPLKKAGISTLVMKPGQTIKFQGRTYLP